MRTIKLLLFLIIKFLIRQLNKNNYHFFKSYIFILIIILIIYLFFHYKIINELLKLFIIYKN